MKEDTRDRLLYIASGFYSSMQQTARCLAYFFIVFYVPYVLAHWVMVTYCTGWSATIHTRICLYSDAGIPINDDLIALHSNGAKFWNGAIWGRWLNGSHLNRELTLKTNLSIWIHLVLIGHIRSVSFFYDYMRQKFSF